ncbi:MAG: electron transfer flavoprotein subunit alpha [Desulfobacteraceae bacterium]|nr:MAG: electron transfer flavoprotein subunit alpha [Desulfobacteraceae bacterium]
MASIKIHQNNIKDRDGLLEVCPFNALEWEGEELVTNASCKMCKLCAKNGPEGVFEFKDDPVAVVDKSLWKGIAVYVDHDNGKIHPVTYELIGKAKEMAAKIDHPVYAVFMGAGITQKADEILAYGVDEVFVYDHEALTHFRIEPYTAVMEDFINRHKPTIVLVGGTTVGRSLAPRAAARFRTGLTADCTILDVQENTDLDQIRPAFGGNIMAHIQTPAHRPQFATVRYKIFSAPVCVDPTGVVTICDVEEQMLESRIRVLEVAPKQASTSIEDAEVIVVAGRGVKQEKDMELVQRLADLLGARLAATRPLIEAGWADPKTQIGLSGRTVKPKLIITCGVSGAVQFTAGMTNADLIMAINNDPGASIFDIAHIGIQGDLYDILPDLIEKIEATEENVCTTIPE